MERKYVTGKVSVIVPVFNAGKHIDKTLESVFAQTYKDIEVILVDDCSKDNSSQIIAKYKEIHPEIVYFLQPKNMGAGVARNKALELATGQYVAFLDSDDLWLSEKTDKQLKLMKKRKSPFSYAAIEMIDEHGRIIKSKRRIKEKCDYKYLLHNTIIATSSVIVDRAILGDFKMSLRRSGQDYATWLMLLRDGVVACGINEALVRYRVSKKSLSSNKLKSVKQVWEIQIYDEGITKFKACINVVFFSLNAFKKHYL